jgi:hypothetical protein
MDPAATPIATALALGAATILKPTAEQAIKDTYVSLKALIKRKYAGVSIEQLEAAPESAESRSLITQELATTDADKNDEVLFKTRQLLDAIISHAPNAADAIGVDLARIKATSLTVDNIIATLRIQDADVNGPVIIQNVDTNRSPKA